MSTDNHIEFSTILASSVHDMKNSLGMLISSLEHLLEDLTPKDNEQAGQISTLHYEASRINAELIQLLTLYRMDSKFLPVQIDEHFVGDLLEDQLARMQPLIDSKKIQVEVDCDSDLAWYFDVDLIGGVIYNVLVNTLRYTETRIKISVSLSDQCLSIEICDDGKGFPDLILQQPSQLKEMAEISRGNTHLGFYFAEQIAALHKRGDKLGAIFLSNDSPMGGACFRLVLP